MREQKIKLAENLDRLMAAKGLTVTATARKIGMNKSTLHNYCNGVVPRHLPKLKELADLLEVTLHELLFSSQQSLNKTSVQAPLEGRFEITIKRVDG